MICLLCEKFKCSSKSLPDFADHLIHGHTIRNIERFVGMFEPNAKNFVVDNWSNLFALAFPAFNSEVYLKEEVFDVIDDDGAPVFGTD